MYDNVTNNDIVWIRAVFICPIFFENSDPSLHLLIRGVLRPWLKIMLPKIEKKKTALMSRYSTFDGQKNTWIERRWNQDISDGTIKSHVLKGCRTWKKIRRCGSMKPMVSCSRSQALRRNKAPTHQVAASDRMTRCTVRWTVPVAASKSPALARRVCCLVFPDG